MSEVNKSNEEQIGADEVAPVQVQQGQPEQLEPKGRQQHPQADWIEIATKRREQARGAISCGM